MKSSIVTLVSKASSLASFVSFTDAKLTLSTARRGGMSRRVSAQVDEVGVVKHNDNNHVDSIDKILNDIETKQQIDVGLRGGMTRNCATCNETVIHVDNKMDSYEISADGMMHFEDDENNFKTNFDMRYHPDHTPKYMQPTFRLPLIPQILPTKKVGSSPKKARYASIMLGNPRKEFKVLLDTGSAHLIIPGQKCKSTACEMHTRFIVSDSTTAKEINVDGSDATRFNRDQMSVSFGRGEVTGTLAKDEICIPLDSSHTNNHPAILESANHTIEKAKEFCVPLHFLTAEEMSDEPFTRFEFDGVMGMSLKGLAQTPKFNFPHMLASGHFLLEDDSQVQGSDHVQNVFAVYLAKNDDKSQVHFGGWDSELLTSEISWTPVARPELGYWTTRITDVKADGVSLPLCQKEDCYAVFDSGTSGIAAPGDAVSFMRDQLDPHFYKAYDPTFGSCNKHGDFDILEVSLEGTQEKLVFSANDLARPKTIIDNTTEACQASIFQINMPPPLGPNIFILGEPVLQKYYTIFDVENERVGTALFEDKV